MISRHAGEQGSVTVKFHSLAPIDREAVVLPAGTLERLERHAIGVAAQAQRLLAEGRQLKRGVLLHGPPGTGKTLSINYLLNQMEGLAEDCNLLFLLTTNRADLIEPALATRPGRVDLAPEIPLPDQAARTMLARLYAGEIQLDDDTVADVVARTEGLTGAFIKELMRQAALRAALADRQATSADASAALDELLEEPSCPADCSARVRMGPTHPSPGHPRSRRCSTHSERQACRCPARETAEREARETAERELHPHAPETSEL